MDKKTFYTIKIIVIAILVYTIFELGKEPLKILNNIAEILIKRGKERSLISLSEMATISLSSFSIGVLIEILIRTIKYKRPRLPEEKQKQDKQESFLKHY
ncbi:hypothetical protein [Capnocytophaga sputigena]|uniref:hypothetical protein n=1 Tax=Capnocytophaga sputigena TaxID=1019 RepID=UPI003C76B441